MKTTGNWKLSQAAGALALALSLFAFGSCSNMLTELRPISQVEAAKAELDESMIQLSIWDSSLATGVSGDFFLPSEVRGVTIVWTVDDPATITLDGTVARVMQPGDEATRTVTATFTRYGVSVTKTFQVAVKPAPAEGVAGDAEAVAAVTTLLSEVATGTTAAQVPILGLASGDSPLAVTRPLALPTSGPGGTTIVWSSSNPAVISPDGTVLRPSSDTDDTEVILTATVYRNGVASDTPVSFPVTVSAAPADDATGDTVAVSSDASGLRPITGQAQTLSHLTGDIILPTTGAAGSSIVWASSHPGLITTDGRVTRPTATTAVTLTATVMRGSEKRTLTMPVTVLAAPAAPAVKVLADQRSVSPTFASGDSVGKVTADLVLPTTGPGGSTISWAADPAGIIDPVTGVVTRHATNAQLVTLVATITSGSETTTRTYSVLVPALPFLDLDAVTEARFALSPVFASGDSSAAVTSNLNLPNTGAYGTTINWTSSNSAILNVDGTVTRSSAIDTPVTLGATIARGFVTASRQFTVIIKGLAVSDTQAVSLDVTDLEPRLPAGSAILTGTSIVDLTGPLGLPTSGPRGSTISWTSSRPDILRPDGSLDRTLVDSQDGDTDPGEDSLTLTATVSRGGSSTTTTFEVTIPAPATSDAQKVLEDYDAIDIDYVPGNAPEGITGKLELPAGGPSGTTISWSSSDPAIINPDGSVTRPVYGDRQVVLNATISSGAASIVKGFDLTVLKRPDRELERVAADAAALRPGFASGDAPYHVSAGLDLPRTGPSGTTITWTASPAHPTGPINPATGTVNRPAEGNAGSTVTLIATVSGAGGSSTTKSFDLSIPAAAPAPSDTLAVAADLASIVIDFAEGDSPLAITDDLELPAEGGNDTVITWVSSKPDIFVVGTKIEAPSAPSYYPVTIVRPPFFADDSVSPPVSGSDEDVILTATAEKDGTTGTRTINIKVKKEDPTPTQAVTEDAKEETILNTITFAGGDDPANVTDDIELPNTGGNGTTYTWNAEKDDERDVYVIPDFGGICHFPRAPTAGDAPPLVVTRPAADTDVTITGTVSKPDGAGGTSSNPTSVTIKVKGTSSAGTGNVALTISVSLPSLAADPVFGLPTEDIVLYKRNAQGSADSQAITATAGFAGYRWVVDGTSRSTAGSFTLDASQGYLHAGEHTLQLWVNSGGTWHSSDPLYFRVEQTAPAAE